MPSQNYRQLNHAVNFSVKQDLELGRIIQKYGTSDWALVRKHFKSSRSRDSVIKRWHGKLKFEKQFSSPPEKQKILNPPIVTGEVTSRRVRQATRAALEKTKLIRNSTILSKNQYQRLRNQVEGTKTARTRKVKSQENSKKQHSEMIEQQPGSHQSPSISSSSFQDEYALEWTKVEDEKLRFIVIQQGITCWERIATLMNCSEKEVKHRWKKAIYDMIKLDDKVGGFLKYSTEEDTILTIGHRNGLNWEELMAFLPGRSQFSIEARWRRLVRPELEVQLSKNKHYIMRQFLKKIIEKKRSKREALEQKIEYQAGK